MFEQSLRRYLSSRNSSPTGKREVIARNLRAICRAAFSLVAWAGIFVSSPCLAAADQLRFSHQLSLHPIPPLQSFISLVSEEGGRYKSVRALLVLDGELLAVPMLPESDGKSYRGTFPRPRDSLSYRFQVVNDQGGTKLSRSFEITPDCIRGQFLPHQTNDVEIRRALSSQQQRQRLLSSRDLLRKFMERIGDGR